jgi:hypothetical protein
MILKKTYDTTAKWDFELNKWQVYDKPHYQWDDASPVFDDLQDALNWIIEHDQRNHRDQTTEEITVQVNADGT